jgi:hypothetical protein
MRTPKTAKKKADYRVAVSDGDLRQPIALTDFLQGLGVVMRLPMRRPPTPAEPVAAAEPPKSGPRRPPTLAISLILASVIVAAFVVPPLLPKSSDPLPEPLIGRWHSPSPKYIDRGLEFREDALYMKRGPKESDIVRLPIRRVTVTPRQGSLAVEINYVENGATLALRLTLHDYAGMPAMELRNQPEIIWRKTAAPSVGGAVPQLLPPAALGGAR